MDYKRRDDCKDSTKLVTEAGQGESSRYKIIENGLITIYENENKERTVDARELHNVMKVGRDFTNWIKGRIKKYYFIENEDYFLTLAKIGERQNVIKHEYHLKVDVAKEIAMVENNEIGRRIRRYFIEVEKRYNNVVSMPTNIFDFMRLALDQIEASANEIQNIKLLSETNANIIVAGGLNKDNVSEAIAKIKPFGIDVNSGVQNEQGFKDYKKLKDFINNAKNV